MFVKEEMMQDEGFKAFLAEQIAAVTEGLESNATKLKEDLRKAKLSAGKVSDDEIETLRVAAAKAAEYERKQMEDKGEWEKLTAQSRDQHAAAVAGLEGDLAKERKTTRKLLIDGGLASALAANNCNPALLTASVKLLADDITVVEQDGVFVAKVGDLSVADYVKEWATGDVGKNFMLAPMNSGGGGKPFSEGGGVNEAEGFFDPNSVNFNRTKQFELRQSDPDMHAQLAAKYDGVQAKQNPAAQGGAPVPDFKTIAGGNR